MSAPVHPATQRVGIAVIGLLALVVGCWSTGLGQGRAAPGQGGQRGEGGQGTSSRPAIPLAPVRAPVELGQTAYDHIARIVDFGARDVGSEGWRKGLHYIATEIRRLGLEPVRDRWTDERDQVTFENISVTLPGTQPERIVLACHHDTKRTHGHRDPARNFHFVGANDSGSGVGLLLALLGHLKDGKRRATLQFVFLDGEESLDWEWNDAVRALYGSRRFVRQHRDRLLLGEESRIAALILLDMVGRKDLQIDEETKSTPELREILWSAAVACGHQARVFRNQWPVNDDHLPFLDVGIPAVDIIDLHDNPDWHKPSDTLDKLSPDSLRLVADLVLTMLPEVERRYVPAVPTGPIRDR